MLMYRRQVAGDHRLVGSCLLCICALMLCRDDNRVLALLDLCHGSGRQMSAASGSVSCSVEGV